MGFHLAGFVSSFFFLLTVYGLWLQLQTILNRKSSVDYEAGYSSEVLRLNRFNSSFLAYFSIIFTGLVSTPFNHYLVWPRILAAILTVVILWEIYLDRRDTRALSSFSICLSALAVLLWWSVHRPQITPLSTLTSQLIAVGVTCFLAQSYISQTRAMRESRSTGAINLRTHQLLLLKDISTLVLGITMGFDQGWPVILMSAVSVLNQGALLREYWIISNTDRDNR